jgi:hypothetical protein
VIDTPKANVVGRPSEEIARVAVQIILPHGRRQALPPLPTTARSGRWRLRARPPATGCARRTGSQGKGAAGAAARLRRGRALCTTDGELVDRTHLGLRESVGGDRHGSDRGLAYPVEAATALAEPTITSAA